jgi:catechol 2,3-dioxygenase-like lactoylglutathione lyase family enzyme
VNVDRLDHLVLTVADIDATTAFYTHVLGMTEQTFRGGRKAVVFGSSKINLHQAGKEFEPKAEHPTPGSADLCFIVGNTLGDVITHLQACNVAIEEGPVERTGAQGLIMSVHPRPRPQPHRAVELSGCTAQQIARSLRPHAIAHGSVRKTAADGAGYLLGVADQQVDPLLALLAWHPDGGATDVQGAQNICGRIEHRR